MINSHYYMQCFHEAIILILPLFLKFVFMFSNIFLDLENYATDYKAFEDLYCNIYPIASTYQGF